ncbi:MAG: hypothetical protein Q8M18_05730 [Bradyrhizobium sp.]|nr:hypothetical protein [Bradyrhizobium sp.]
MIGFELGKAASTGQELMHSHENPNRPGGKITACIAALQIEASKIEGLAVSHLAERSKRCYICFARNENKLIFLEMSRDFCAAAD